MPAKSWYVYSEVLGWGCLRTARFWFVWVALTFGWSAGVGLALESVRRTGACKPLSVMPLITAPDDIARLPLRVLNGVPFGLNESGLVVGFLFFLMLLVPMARLPRGVIERYSGWFIVLAAACILRYMGWSFELAYTFAHGTLPTLVCSNG